MKTKHIHFLSFILLVSLFPALSYAQLVQLPHIFSNDMVFQRDKPIKVWGKVAKQNTFEVSFAGLKKKVKPQKDGSWVVEFPSMKSGGPYQMTFKTDTAYNLNNILIGDIWVCSGQSNMDLAMKATYNSAYELAKADNPSIRCFKVPLEISATPCSDFSSGKWMPATFENIADISAVAYFYAKQIQQSEKVPIGIVCTSWGGSPIEAWTSMESISSHPDFQERIKIITESQENPESFTSLLKKFNTEVFQWQNKIELMDSGYVQKWYKPEYVAEGWQTMNAPGFWEYNGLPNYDGIVWLRKEINIPASMTGKPLILNLEILNNYDMTWFNGVKIGTVSWDGGRRIYQIPANIVKQGKNSLVIRVENTSGNGGFSTLKESDMFIREMLGEQAVSIPLAGQWLYKPSMRKNSCPSKPQNPVGISTPSCIYNAMIAPITNLSIKGFIWYQGEANASRAYQYRSLFPLLINDWRKQFNQGDIPFLFVQLAGFGALTKDPVENNWAELRESQTMALKLSNTGMAVAIDIGNPTDIHPTNKQEVGRRLGIESQRIAYGKPDLRTSPLYKNMQLEGNKVIISFTNAENGLLSAGEKIGGFAIADNTKKFVWANVKIENDKVVVWSDKIQNPVAVRYAWTGAPVESNDANLFNKEGFPVSPFRTDDWEGITRNNK